MAEAAAASATEVTSQGAPSAQQQAAPQQASESNTSLLAGQANKPEAGQGAAAPNAANGEQKGSEAQKGAPEAYQAFAMPEGVTLDETSFKSFTELAKADGLTQEQAQKYADIGAGLVQRTIEAIEQQKADQSARWMAEVRSDKELGGQKMQETLTKVSAFLAAFGDQDLVDALTEAGRDNHPAVIRAFAKAGAALSQDSIVTGNATSSAQEKTAAQILFPTMN